MKFTLCIVALAVMVSVEARPDTVKINIDNVGDADSPDFFKEKLKSVQGAIYDTLKAGMDLQDMEDSLRHIVDSSSFFYRTESATTPSYQRLTTIIGLNR